MEKTYKFFRDEGLEDGYIDATTQVSQNEQKERSEKEKNEIYMKFYIETYNLVKDNPYLMMK